MSICFAIAVPDGIALAADSQITWNQTITKVKRKGTNEEFELAVPINVPISWSKMARKLFSIHMAGKTYAVCIAGVALLNRKTIYAIFKSLEKAYNGEDSFDRIVRHLIEGIKNELRVQLQIRNLEAATTGLSVNFILCGYESNDISKPRIESWMVFSGIALLPGGGQLNTGEHKSWTNYLDGQYTYGSCWIGRGEFVSHLVLHNNPGLPAIQGQNELLSLADATDYARFLVEFTCDYQRFAIMVPDCARPIVNATLTVDAYEEKIN